MVYGCKVQVYGLWFMGVKFRQEGWDMHEFIKQLPEGQKGFRV